MLVLSSPFSIIHINSLKVLLVLKEKVCIGSILKIFYMSLADRSAINEKLERTGRIYCIDLQFVRRRNVHLKVVKAFLSFLQVSDLVLSNTC